MSRLIAGKRLKALADKHEMTPDQTDVLLMTLGQTRGNLDPRWNHFVAADEDLSSCKALVDRGFLEKKADLSNGSQVFAATEVGRILCSRMVVEVRLDEAPDGFTNKWHERYRRYLQDSPETSFGSWWNAENARRSLEGSAAKVFGVDPALGAGITLDKSQHLLEKECHETEREAEPWTEMN